MTEKKVEKDKKDIASAKTKPEQPIRPYAHIEDFLLTAKEVYKLDSGKMLGFRAYMQGKHYLKEEKDFIPHMDKYLGKED